ncbi:MAG: TerB family tellurite resistance protein [Gammaproteobacteria bacterium]
MLKRWLQQLGDVMTSPSTEAVDAPQREHALRVATAALMVDVARADHQFDETELALMLKLMAERFELSDDETQALANTAQAAAQDAVSVYEFTQQLHEHLSDDEKAAIVGLLWQVAYADGQLDKYENSLVLKISDLLFVSRGLVMRLKHDAASAG